jgi:outer membrane immunogenic protein
MKRVALAVALSTIAGSAAVAADLPPAQPMPRAPAIYTPAPVPYYNWTGFYIGGNAGVGWQQGNLSDPFGNSFGTSNSLKGLGGGQVGVNYEFNNGVVVGAEAMFDWRFNNNNTSPTITLLGPGGLNGTTASITTNNQWLTTATGKLGYAWDRVMVYAKGGGAWVGSNNPTIALNGTGVPVNSSTSSSNWGWTVGAGAEYAFYGGWSARIEYDYIGLTNQTFTVVPGIPATAPGTVAIPAGDQFTFNNRNIQMVTAGINYKFGGGWW